MTTINLREYESHDFAAIVGLWELTGLGDANRGDNAIIIERSIQHGGKFYLLEDLSTNELIGTCWITTDTRRLYLHHLGIHPNYQHRGYGRLLTQKALDFAKSKNMQIKLEVHQENQTALNLYRKLGFDKLEGYEVMIKRKH
ncbi:GNAT family N-acetyltransferase [Ancylomarina longa]|nr:GNAT family N-acetyltransferase [Ancylomarina longa]